MSEKLQPKYKAGERFIKEGHREFVILGAHDEPTSDGQILYDCQFNDTGVSYLVECIIDECEPKYEVSYIAEDPHKIQIGGDHYKKCKIQPIDYIFANGLDFFQGSIVKYITRFRDKGGKQDLLKIKHYVDLLIELEYSEEKNV